MKKIVSLILVVVLTLSLFGCKGNDTPVGTTDPTVNTEATLGDHEHDHGEVTKPVDDEQDATTEPTENSTEPSTEATTEPTDGETVPNAPDDIGNGGVEDLPEHPNTEPAPTQPAHKHDYKSKVVNPTCDSKGYTEYTCTCGDSYKSDYKDAKGHDYKSKTVAPTCESKGYTKYTCNACGKSYKDNEKSATGHSYKTETVAPTTESKGYDLHTCSKCGASYKDNYTDKLPAPTEHQHEWVWTEYVGPYACREGYNLYTCACGESYKEGTGDVLECNWQVDHVVEPTTESEGYTVYKCSVCGNTWTDYDRPKLPAPTEPAPTEPAPTEHKHSYTSKVTSPTCESKGYTTYTCSCGDSYTADETKATGHNYKTETVAPTTDAEGYDIHTCSKCGKSYKDNYTDKLPAPTEPAPTEPAKCTNHEASADVLASVTVSGNWYNARCHCDYGTLYTADTREGAIALVHAHIAEHGGKSETHYVVCVIGFEQYDYPAFFDCIHCGETCIYTDYYNWKECISEEYFDYATAP